MNWEHLPEGDYHKWNNLSPIIELFPAIYREGNKTIISFEGGDNTIKEARPLHLRGKKFVVAKSDDENNLIINMNQIFLPESEITNTIKV